MRTLYSIVRETSAVEPGPVRSPRDQASVRARDLGGAFGLTSFMVVQAPNGMYLYGIWEAAEAGNLEAVKRLVAVQPSRLNRKARHSHRGLTALTVASYNGRLEVARWLVNNGADIDVRDSSYHSNTALYHACERGRLGVVRLLLEKGADPTIVDDMVYTPLDVGI
jgi:hypothetical protein